MVLRDGVPRRLEIKLLNSRSSEFPEFPEFPKSSPSTRLAWRATATELLESAGIAVVEGQVDSDE